MKIHHIYNYTDQKQYILLAQNTANKHPLLCIINFRTG